MALYKKKKKVNFVKLKKLFISISLFPLCLFSQKADTLINAGNYKSYYSFSLKEPVCVKYVLHNGGGNCSRESYRFKSDTNVKDVSKLYLKSGYDKGHLANAEDFAYSCVLLEKTFRYYNCLPQTPNLNRGVWKSWETKIREISRTDSLLILTGGIWKSKINNSDTMAIPKYCWKVVYSLKSKTVLHVLLFTNLKTNSTVKEIRLKDLEKLLKYKIVFLY